MLLYISGFLLGWGIGLYLWPKVYNWYYGRKGH